MKKKKKKKKSTQLNKLLRFHNFVREEKRNHKKFLSKL
jgi:hypothetical protein